MTTRIARCSCGALTAEARGEPTMVLACHCTECQRRTGSAFGLGAYYPAEQVTLAGPAKTYVRPCPEGRRMRNHFCPDCGTSLYWESALLPGAYGIAVGAFNDPGFPKPARSVWEDSRLRWLAFGADIPGNKQGRQSPPSR
jgi:hypothetical protein